MTISYTVGDLPIWRGAQETPAFEVAPFTFELDVAGIVRLQHSAITEALMAAYADLSYHFITSPPGASRWGNELAGKSLDGLVALHPQLVGTDVLELGGGTLFSAEHLVSRLGVRSVTLVDPAVHEAPTDDRVQVIREYFGFDTPLDRRFPVIMSFNTLEHVPDPVAFLRAARERLEDDGVLYLKMPECEASLEMGDLGLCVHEHLSYFTEEFLDTVLARAGLQRVGQANYQGALQVLARRTEPAPEARAGSGARLMDAFAARAGQHIEWLRAFAQEHSGQEVAFVGASVGLANLLHLSGIADDVLLGIFDGDDLKAGRYLPGVDVAIRRTADAELARYRHIFVVPVNFAQEIRAGLQARPELSGATIAPAFATA